MLNDLLGAIWRRSPKFLRRWAVTLGHPRFAVSAGAIITDDRERVLLLRHRFRPGSGWGMPGGFLEKGEQPEEGLRRELREEVGLEVAQLKLIGTRAFRKPRQIELVYTARAIGNIDQLSFEIKEAVWFALDQLPAALPNAQVQLIKGALTDGASPLD
jgi:8-oxo-dGTP diphosphatase